MPNNLKPETHTGATKKEVAQNIVYGVLATSIPIVALQIIVLPLVSGRMQDEVQYGLALTLIGIVNLFASVGGALNNSRLLTNQSYEQRGVVGDYNLLALTGSLLCAVLAGGISVFYMGAFSIRSILVALITGLAALHTYALVGFRLKINFKRILISNIVQAAGYFAGYLLFIATGLWELILLAGYVAGLIYIMSRSTLHREPIAKTVLFKSTAINVAALCLSFVLANTFTYVDRLLLYPRLGGAAVTIYYVSTLFGKLISMGMTPISGVMLSYFARMSGIRRRTIALMLGVVSAIAVAGFFVCMWIGPSVLRLLYPDQVVEALIYLPINTITALISMICLFLNPVIMKFRSITWQIVVPAVNLALYVAISLPMMQTYGLMGFCGGALIATAAKLVMMIVICFIQKPSTTFSEVSS